MCFYVHVAAAFFKTVNCTFNVLKSILHIALSKSKKKQQMVMVAELCIISHCDVHSSQ